MKIPEVTTFGWPSGGGSRMSQFRTETGLVVSVQGGDADSTPAAFGLACELARSFAVAIDLRDEIEVLKSQLHAAKKRIPPATPARLMGIGYVRFVSGVLWLLGDREKGFAAFGYRVGDWDELFRRWNVRVIDNGTDEHGAWWAVDNCEASR